MGLMAVNRIVMPASPEEVFAVLGDPHRYADWVVGARNVRGTAGDWPSPDARFFHSTGVGPLTLQDETEVVELDDPRRLVLRAKARPILVASVTLTVTAGPGGSEVVMEEHPTGPLPTRLLGPLFDPLTSRRNDAALRRLKDLVEAGPWLTPSSSGPGTTGWSPPTCWPTGDGASSSSRPRRRPAVRCAPRS